VVASLSSVKEWQGIHVSLLKIHGSLNWAFPGKRGARMTIFDDYQRVAEKGLTPVILPPTWQKDRTNQLVNVWSGAVDALSTATRVVVIGFSLPPTDNHFKYLLSAGLRTNISLRTILFVDPYADDPTFQERVHGVLANHLTDRGMLKFVKTTLGDFTTRQDMLRLINRPVRPGCLVGQCVLS
jgi:hypothetical protein